MSIFSDAFENIRKMQGRHKGRYESRHKVEAAYLFNCVLSLIFLAGSWILIKYGVDNDRYFWIGTSIVILAGLAVFTQILINDKRRKGR